MGAFQQQIDGKNEAQSLKVYIFGSIKHLCGYMRVAINAAIIQDSRLLLVRKVESWILPGGKPKEGEEDLVCLRREVREELSGTELNNFRFCGDFEGITPHKGDKLRARVYFADIDGQLGQPSAEIAEYAWIGKDTSSFRLSDITRKIIESLKLREDEGSRPKKRA